MITIVLISNEEDKLLLTEKLKKYSCYPIVIDTRLGMAEARKAAIAKVITPFCLCLDMDTDLPDGYIEEAITLLSQNDKLVCIALDYEKSQGHYAFGTSIWKTKVLKQLYDYKEGTDVCECIWMNHKVLQAGLGIDTIGKYRAIHNKGVNTCLS